ncbi:MAG: DinB family protein [Gemmatimonadota bacterium]|nr:DinB family protein [Gemmatimonadota bacterium]
MLADDLGVVMARELRAVAKEVAAYPTDEALWRTVPGITNPGGTLALHLAGNLQHFIGKVLGGSAYVRDRDAEFGRRGEPRAAVVAEVERTIPAVVEGLKRVTAAQWEAEYPQEVGGKRFSTRRFALHLCSHLAYHLGQMDYHRRTVAPDSGTAGTVSLAEL